jgi:hypothetical protein
VFGHGFCRFARRMYLGLAMRAVRVVGTTMNKVHRIE